MRMDVVAGTVIAGFRVESLLGEGAMGTVYVAEETTTGRRVALKLLAPELASDERFRARFLRETEVAASLADPHVVPTLASGEEDGILYLAMALVEGSDLRKLLRSEGRFAPQRALDVIGQVASALDTAHAAGLVHRDVKPANILVEQTDDDEKAYVCDFGLARHVTSVSSLTSDRGFVGTIDYVPPEQVEGGTVDGRADVYSLGCVLFECLSGERPFDRESELSVLFAHLNDPPPRITELRPELPAAFDALFETALAKSPDQRYASCGELVQAAGAAVQGKVLARRRRIRRHALAALGTGVLVAAAVAGTIVATRGAPRGATPAGIPLSLRPSALNLVDARTHRVVDHVDVGTQVPVADTSWNEVFTKHAAWVLLDADQPLVRIDLRTHKLTVPKGLPWSPGAAAPWFPGSITSTRKSVWVAEDGGPELLELDADSGKVLRRVTVQGGQSEGGIAYGAGSLWLVSGNGVIRVDPKTGRIVHRPFPVRGISGMRLVFADGALYAARQGNGLVVKIDPGANRITHQPLHGWISDLVVGGGSVWVSIVPGGVYRLSKDDLSLRQTLSAGPDPEQISFGGGALWITDPNTGSVSRVAQVSGARKTFSGRGADPATAAYHAGLVWVAASPALPPLRPVSGQQLDVVAGGVQLDPARYGLFDEQTFYATCAKLLNYPDAAGAAGARLQPEIAAAMPTVSADGRTYTFRIRSGFRFSPPSDEAVTAETFRHTIERLIAPSPDGPGLDPYVADIVGAKAFYAGKARQVAGLSVHGDRLSITLVNPAGDFPTRVAMPEFCPVPLSVPVHGGGARPIPSAGPYYIASSLGPRTVLLPNPNYHGPRPHRSARIVVESDVPEAKAISLADHGQVDVITQTGAGELLAPGGVIDRRAHTSSTLRNQYHVYQAPIFDYFVFNTRRPLFRNSRLRRAVDYALDRRALAAAFGDYAADRVVPPAAPGYPAGRIYPLTPDLPAARKLAGHGKRHAALYICGDPRGRDMAEIVRRNLAPIGIRVSVLEDADQCPVNPSTSPKSRRADLFLVSGDPFTKADDREPAQFLGQVLREGAYGTPLPSAGWDERSFHRDLDRAQSLRGPKRVPTYHRLADKLTRTGPIAVFGSWVWSEYFSRKVGCKVVQGEYGVTDLGALCKRG
jgi:ABC-type transport system substrate-binding protein/tRNA A-37 threonylcarbamoyl transferase component Bud32